ncbi:complement C3 alpha chain-like [Pyxicephalus adspersus]|uniref:complement C3 alpha chain-like n=1 Tax=Pyxicephalus adspersus TaxID=30357 RepID=UPI003B5B4A42
MVFQALAQYVLEVPLRKDLEMDVSFQLPGRTRTKTLRLDNRNSLSARSDQTSMRGDFVVTAKGKGQGSFSAFSVYYAIETEKERQCKNFDLTLTVQEEPFAKGPEGTLSTYGLTICTSYLKSFNFMQLKKGVDKFISNFEINKGAFDKSTLILYIDRISHTEDACLTFNLHQYFKVGLIQPASVTVYDYYSPVDSF